MREIPLTKEQFLKDVEGHKLSIIKNDGLYRHIRMSSGSFAYEYDVVTWPGHLCITGDCGSYLFSRITDMFDFFKTKSGEINPHYWAEKVLSESVYGHGIKEFSVEKFDENVIEWATEDIEDEEEKSAMMEEIDSLLHCGDEWECVQTLRGFDSDKVDFTDFWELNCEEYTPQYLWCLYGIVYAIQKYDEYLLEVPDDNQGGK